MLDLSKTYTYTGSGDEQYNYYGDYQDKARFYIEPQIKFAVDPDTNLPVFKAVQYETSDSYNKSGYCTFTVELEVPNDVINQVISDIKNKGLSSNPNISPFEYLDGGTARFQYPNPQDPKKYLSASAVTSALGSNRASFLVQFSPEEMETFIATYKQKGAKGWPVQFFEKVNGVTPAITVEVNFDASIVRKYQDKVTHHTWKKNTHDITDEVNSSMPKGENWVKVTPGSPEPSQKVMDAMKKWGQDQLDAQIAKMVEEGQKLKDKKEPATWFYSFNRKFQENQVIPWNIKPNASMPSPVTDANGWDKFFTTVDLRQFTLLVTMNVDDRKLPHADKVKSITINVDYPTLSAPKNSVILTPTNASHTFESPIAKGGNLEYNWEYVVTYNDGSQLQVKQNNQRNSAITISAPDVGILNVEFNTSYIEFKTPKQAGSVAVQGLEVDFFYKDLSGQDHPITQQILFGFPTGEKDHSGNPVYEHPLTYNFVSKTRKPIYNAYIYTPKYRMTDGTELVADAVESNANIVMDRTDIGSDFSRDNIIYLHSSVNSVDYFLMYLPPEDTQVIRFNVKVNQVQGDGSLKFVGEAGLVPNHTKNDTLTNQFQTSTLNPANQPYSISGTMLTRTGPIEVRAFIRTESYVTLYDNKRWFSVQIDPSLLRFEEDDLALVQVDIAETEKGPLRAQQFKAEMPKSKYWTYSHDASKSPSYYCKVTYSYTGQKAKTVEYKDQTVNIFTIPATPKS